MNVLLALTIVATGADAPTEARYPGATEIFHCPFDASWDKNFDHWPDEWSRRQGPGFPSYVAIEIRERRTPAGPRCLRIDLNGGSAAASSPPIPVSPLFSYVLDGLLSAELEHDRVYLSLTLLDKEWHPLETYYSKELGSKDVGGSDDWKTLRLGPVAPRSDRAELAIIGLHVEPGSRPDLTGKVQFGEVWLGRLPRITLSADNPHHVFAEQDPIAVTCNASGLSTDVPAIEFQLEDAFGAVLAEKQGRLNTSPALEPPGASASLSGSASPGATGSSPARAFPALADKPPVAPIPPSTRGSIEASSAKTPARVGSIRWDPPAAGLGFYRVRASVHDGDGTVYHRELTYAVIRPQSGPPGGEFGWSLPQSDKPLPPANLSRLVGQAGIGWVKYPLWFDETTSDDEIEQAVRFSQDLNSQGIELVGLLHNPPQALRSQFPRLSSPVELFVRDPHAWYPSLESAIARMGVQVRWWQLGRDKDTGFVGYPKLAERIAEIRGQFGQLGHDLNLGFGWDWRAELPQAPEKGPPWRFLVLSAEPPLGPEELAARLAESREPKVRHWVVLEPLPRGASPLEARAADLARRMVFARIGGADAIFIPDPFRTDRGLMNDDGTVGELFLPWRTTALMIREADYLGSIQLPGASQNHVFARGTDAVMVVWNSAPKQEALYLGDDVRQVDLWGRTTPAGKQEHGQVVEVGPLPTFVTGVDEKIARWRQSFALLSERVPSASGGPHANGFRLANPFDREVSGRLQLVAPRSWTLDPQRIDFRLAPGEKLERPFTLTLPLDATNGRHPIRADFELAGEPARRFSVYRHVDLGPSDVYIEVASRLNGRRELEVEQCFVNEAQTPVSFRCYLLAPNRRREKTQIIGLGHGRQTDVYRLPDGDELVGKILWLRAEEIDGPRVLNYRFVAGG